MRVGIIGAGALGCLSGGYLHANGEEVYLYDVREEIVEAIDEDGLRIEWPEGDDVVVHPPATTDPAEIGPVDVALVFVKAYDTADAVASAAPMIDEDTTVVTVQNGLKNVELIAERVPPERVLGGATTMGANTIAPGRVRQFKFGTTTLGGPDAAAAERVAALLTGAGFETVVVDDPTPYIWDKGFVNVGIKPVAALTELTNGQMHEFEGTRRVMRALIEEAMAVARAADIEIVSDDPVAHTFDICRGSYDKQSSILEDVQRGRPTEIGHINGAVVEYAERAGVDAPYNRMTTALVEGKERGYRGGQP